MSRKKEMLILNNVFLKTGVSNCVQLVRLFSRSVQNSAAESKPASKPERFNDP
jgi:hypothetical protein